MNRWAQAFAICAAALYLAMARPAYPGKLPMMPAAEQSQARAESRPSARSATLEDLKLRKRFGVGLTAAGALSVFGVEADVNVNEEIAVALGLGTGIDYSTLMIKGRYFLLGEWVSPYLGLGFAKWWTDGTKETRIAPAVLRNKFLEPGHDLSQGFSTWIFFPCVGAQFMHPMGFAVSLELQYLFKMVTFANGTYAGLSAHWYF